jgi:hypothetical protein
MRASTPMGSSVKYLTTEVLGSAYESQHLMGPVLHSLGGGGGGGQPLPQRATGVTEAETLLAAAKAMAKEKRDLWNNIAKTW